MALGIGIDTGGTYTDAVIYDLSTKEILFSSKAITTKEDLAIGIANVLDNLPMEILKQVDIVSLSTTLATNACVEGKGGRGKLVLIGADKEIIDQKGKSYGLPDSNEIFFLDGQISYQGEIVKEPDWQLFLEQLQSWVKDADAIAIVQQLGIRNSAIEEKAKELIEEQYSINTICGHELYSDLNYIKRGSSALLNAKLIPVIEEFLIAIEKSLKERDIHVPVVILRSDGTLMSESFTKIRPVETLLCGPAASVMGAVNLTEEKDCVIVDMGGTTTDLAFVEDRVPIKAQDGVNVGKWKTFVKSIYIDTFGLGGDSRVNIIKNGKLKLSAKKVVPLSVAAERWPQINEKLRHLNDSNIIKSEPLHEFFYLVKDISDLQLQSYDEAELSFLEGLKQGPLIYSEAAQLLRSRSPNHKFDRFEKEGIIMRCGITPTDMMHIKGDYAEFNGEAASLGVSYLRKQYRHLRHNTSILSEDEISDEVYDLVKEKLYINIVRFLLENKYTHLKENGIDENLKEFISDSWKMTKSKAPLGLGLAIPSGTIVGVGAPIHIFLPDVAKALGCKYIIPEYAEVANALGAIVGNVRVENEIEIKPHEEKGFIIYGRKQQFTKNLNDAIEIAAEEAKSMAAEEAIRRGAVGDIKVYTTINDHSTTLQPLYGEFISTTVKAVAVGSITL